MAEYDNEYESWEQHRDFMWDTECEGKYVGTHEGYSRVRGLLDRVPEGSNVMELGCNSGGLMKALMKERYCFCKGVDISAVHVATARRKSLMVTEAPAENTKEPDGKFDAVIASELLEHVFEPSAVIEEAHRILRPGGKLVGSVPHKRSLNSKKGDVSNHHYHCRVFTEHTLTQLLSPYFGSIEIENVPFNRNLDMEKFIYPLKYRRMVKLKTPQWHLFSGVK